MPQTKKFGRRELLRSGGVAELAMAGTAANRVVPPRRTSKGR